MTSKLPAADRRRAFRTRLGGLWLVMLMGLSSCEPAVVPPPSFTTSRDRDFKVIGVRQVPYEDKADRFSRPVSRGIGAAGGAIVGADGVSQTLGRGCTSGGSDEVAAIAAAFCISAIAIGALVGALIGYSAGRSEEEITEATAILKQTLADASPDDRVASVVVSLIDKMGGGIYESRLLSTADAEAPNSVLAERGIDAVFDLEVARIDLMVFGKLDPDAAVAVTVNGRFRDTADQRDASRQSWTHVSARYDYFDLAAKDARVLRFEIDQAYAKVGRLIVSDLLLGVQSAVANAKGDEGGDAAMRERNAAGGEESASRAVSGAGADGVRQSTWRGTATGTFGGATRTCNYKRDIQFGVNGSAVRGWISQRREYYDSLESFQGNIDPSGQFVANKGDILVTGVLDEATKQGRGDWKIPPCRGTFSVRKGAEEQWQ